MPRSRNWLKTLPGIAISLFFLGYRFKGIPFKENKSLHLVHPTWITWGGGFTLASYTLRCVRWTR
jgi:hypothetical protein